MKKSWQDLLRRRDYFRQSLSLEVLRTIIRATVASCGIIAISFQNRWRPEEDGDPDPNAMQIRPIEEFLAIAEMSGNTGRIIPF